MHGSMHNAILRDSLAALAALGVRIIPPRQEDGKDKIPDDPVLVAEVCRAVSRSPLRGHAVLVTGGPTPVPIDNIRRITNKFTGLLGTLIARELYLRGADVTLVHGESSQRPPAWLPHTVVRTYEEHKACVLSTLAEREHLAGVFTAAVADYRPREVAPGKIASGGALQSLELVPTEKVIGLVRNAHPGLHMVTFKYEELLDHDALMAIARRRIAAGYDAVVANRGEESGPAGEQVAWLVTPSGEPHRMVGKATIAAEVASHVERLAE
jgi:phosphopantothenoylcysteine decarboxylase/phosphopantothenate--cysteine ligase